MTKLQELEVSARDKRLLRVVVETYYDCMGVRIQTEHRIRNYAEMEGLVAVLGELEVDNLKRAGQSDYKAAIREHANTKKFLGVYSQAIEDLESEERHDKVNRLMAQQEASLKGIAQSRINGHPVWDGWLKGVKGIGPCLSGGLIAWIDLRRTRHIGSLWKYAGMATVVEKYVCPDCNAEKEPEEVPAIVARMEKGQGHEGVRCDCGAFLKIMSHADRRVKGQQVGYNPRVKTLAWKIGESFVKQAAHKSSYRRLYDTMRERVNEMTCNKVHKDEKGKTIPCFDAHKFAKAKRLTVKLFLSHYYAVARTMAGLPITRPYAFGMLGHDSASFVAPMIDDGKISPEIEQAWRDWK